MNHPVGRQPFIFSESINVNHLFSLYDNDYQWIEEIFTTALAHFDEDVKSIQDHFSTGDLAGLKRAIHKIKPTFGFVGMPVIQDMCKEIEDKSVSANHISEISADVQELLTCCAECKRAIEDDTHRLAQYNKTTG